MDLIRQHLCLRMCHDRTGDSLNNLANTYHLLGRIEEAAVMMEEALQIGRRKLPENHPEIGCSCVVCDIDAAVMNDQLFLRQQNVQSRLHLPLVGPPAGCARDGATRRARSSGSRGTVSSWHPKLSRAYSSNQAAPTIIRSSCHMLIQRKTAMIYLFVCVRVGRHA
jgi:hypothetical protein